MQNKLILIFAALVVGVLVLSELGQAQVTQLYSYSRLALKDLDEMNKIVQSKVRESRASKGDKVFPLREALQAVYSRPNDDFMIDKISSPLRNELDEHMAYESTIRSLVEEACDRLRNADKIKPVAQVTYLVLLENIMAEFKPRIEEKFERALFATIRDAQIQISKKAAAEQKLGMMRPSKSPSLVADELLKALEQKEKEKAKK